jgi:hypothetical protein
MNRFSKRTSGNPNRLPENIVEMMDRFGRFEFDPQGSQEDGGAIWSETQAPLVEFAALDAQGFLNSLASKFVLEGGWSAYGAAHTTWNLLTDETRTGPAYEAIMDASLEFLRWHGIPPNRVTGYEWQHWVSRGGSAETWLPANPIPSQEEAPITELEFEAVRRVAQLWGDPDANQILVRRDADIYVAVIDARCSDEDPTRVLNDWMQSSSLYELYINIGTSLQAPPFWCDTELEPFFPVKRPLL